MKPTQKHTIYDIARRVGASPSTVSAAINGTWEKRRIRKQTAEKILQAAREMGYSVNLQARGLRTASSGLIGLLLPEYGNRFFSCLSQTFTVEARARGQCPVIIATQRNPEQEESTVRQLLGYSIDALFVAGAADPLRIRDLCQQAQLPHVFIDQPCPGSPSVITDNERGARRLTQAVIDTMRPGGGSPRDRIYLIGGDARLHATSRRVAGFRAVVKEHFGTCATDQVMACGYDPAAARAQIAMLHDRLGGLPAAIFANSINVFEEIMRYLVRFPDDELDGISIGCFDYEPHGELLRLPVHMIRQRHRQLVLNAYELLEDGIQSDMLITVEPELYLARTGGTSAGWQP